MHHHDNTLEDSRIRIVEKSTEQSNVVATLLDICHVQTLRSV